MTAAFSNYPYSMSGVCYPSSLESGVTNKLNPYQINPLAAGGFGPGTNPMDIMHHAMNPYGGGNAGGYHNGESMSSLFSHFSQPASSLFGSESAFIYSCSELVVKPLANIDLLMTIIFLPFFSICFSIQTTLGLF